MSRRVLILLALALPGGLGAQEPATPLLVAPATDGNILRWIWPERDRPRGYHVERREPGGPWARLTAQPVARLRDRAAARARLGSAYPRYEALLFPDDPRDELREPDSYRSLLLLLADLEPAVAEVLGLRFDDTAAARGRVYEYRLLVLDGTGEREAARGGPVVAGGWEPPPGPDSLHAAQAPDGVTLRWSAAGPYTAYQVERRRNSGPWERANEAPVLIFANESPAATAAAPWAFRDSTARAGDTLVYAVTGIDPFGRPSRRSAEARIVVRDVRPPAAPLQVTTEVRGDTVLVSWVPSPDPSVTAYRVWRAAERIGPFEPLGGAVPAGVMAARDPRGAGGVTWYYVTAADAGGNESPPSFLAMAVVPDLTPPPVPDSLTGVADTASVVLTWRAVPAADLRGYRVYRASKADGTFALLNAQLLARAAYHDAIRRGADHAFHYRVTAVDSAFNESEPSPVLAVRPPDTRPPSVPRIEWVRPAEDGLVVRWLANPEPDVTAYRVAVRARGDTGWRAGDSIPAPALLDTISGLEPRRLYEVTVLARDDAGNWSAPARAVTGEPVHRRPPAPLAVRRLSYDARSGGVVVNWGAPGATVARVRVERRDRKTGAVEIVTEAVPAAGEAVDRGVARGVEYEYALRPVDRFGNVAEPAGWKRIRVPEARP